MARPQDLKAEEVAGLIRSGERIMVGGFGGTGSPHGIIEALLKTSVSDLTIICNDGGFPDKGVGRLIAAKKVSVLVASHVGNNPLVTDQVNEGTLVLHLLPQGLLAEKIRAGGAGLTGIVVSQAFASPDAIYDERLNGCFEPALSADHALVQAWQCDRYGNLRYRYSAANHNPAMAMAGMKVWAEVTEFLDDGLDPMLVHTPGVWISGIVRERK